MLSKKAINNLKNKFYEGLEKYLQGDYNKYFYDYFYNFINNNIKNIPLDVLNYFYGLLKEELKHLKSYEDFKVLDDKVYWFKSNKTPFFEEMLKFNNFNRISYSSILKKYKDDYKTKIIPDMMLPDICVDDLETEYLYNFKFDSFKDAINNFLKPFLIELDKIIYFNFFIVETRHSNDLKLRYRYIFDNEALAVEWEDLYLNLLKSNYKIYKDISCKFNDLKGYNIQSKVFKYIFDFLLEGFFETFEKAKTYKIDKNFLLKTIKPLYKKDFWTYDDFENGILPVLKLLEENI